MAKNADIKPIGEGSDTDDGFDGQMQAVLRRIDCPSAEDLLAYSSQHLDEGLRHDIAFHLETCATCRRELALLSAPIFPVAQEQTSWLEQAHVYVATLFSSSPKLQLRGDTKATAPAEFIYTVPDTDWKISCKISSKGNGYKLNGRLVGPDATQLEQFSASLIYDNESLDDASLDDTGLFDLITKRSGTFTLWIHMPNGHIEVPDVTLSGRNA